MIISHKHRFIFFAVPRTASHALRQALRPGLGAEDWEQQARFGRQNIPEPGLAALGHGHISFRQLQKHLPARLWSSYFRFGFVRNPFDRFVSTCFFLNRGNPDFAGNEVEFMRRAISNERFRQRILMQPQHRLLTDQRGALMMDCVGRYESLSASFAEICQRVGIAAAQPGRVNASRHRAYQCYYDAPLQQAVADCYRRDFEMFGYDAEETLVAAAGQHKAATR